MDTPAAAPDRLEKDLRTNIPQPSAAIEWVTFGGSAGESSSDFIQAIHRVAFQHGRPRDDEWIADYTSTCFSGNALHWYSELDDETQHHWKRLRKAFLSRYPAFAPSNAPTGVIQSPRRLVPSRSAVNLTAIQASSASTGVIEIIGDRTTKYGYLCVKSGGSIGVIEARSDAARMNAPTQGSTEPVQLSLVTALGGGQGSFSNLGLGLQGGQGQPDEIPREIKINKQAFFEWEGGYLGYEDGIPKASSVCKSSNTWVSYRAHRPPIATWSLALCGDSKPFASYRRRSDTSNPSVRAAAAVWKYENTTGELRVSWLMDDDRECELAGYVNRGSSGESLHFHRLNDMREARRFFEEDRVRFVFHLTG